MGKTIVRIVYALWRVIYARLLSLYLFYQVTGNQEILVQENSMFIIGK